MRVNPLLQSNYNNIATDKKHQPNYTYRKINYCEKIRYTDLSQVYFTGLIQPAKRLQKSDYLISAYISEIVKARKFYGDKAVVDLSMGNPDLTPPEKAKEVLKAKVNDLWAHRYNNPKGESVLLNTAADWMNTRFGVKINPGTEVMVTSGSSDAIDHIFTAFANTGDKILVPNPGYSLYDDLITRHDLTKVPFDLFPQNRYLPDFSKMPKDAKILILNYPHNPTGSFGTKEMFREAVKWAKDTNTLIIHDMDNSEITHTGIKPICIMQINGAKDVAFQVHTFSKAQSMPGYRVAFAVSEKDNIENLLNAKYLSGGSVYVPVQHAAAAALKDEEGFIKKVNKLYRERKNTAIDWLHKLGSDTKPTDGTYYLWAKVPPKFTSDEFFKYILHKSQVAFTPGTVFGTNGEGYVRMVMSAPKEKISECFKRIESAGIRFDMPKSSLPLKTQNEIKEIVSGVYSIEPKSDRDYKEYMKVLKKRRESLKKQFANKDTRLQKFIPSEDIILPWNILKNGQNIYVQDIEKGKPLFAIIKDIYAYSNDTEYKKLMSDIDKQWSKYRDKNSINPLYKIQQLNPNSHYITLRTEDNNLQALANLEINENGDICCKSIDVAPWNQGEKPKIQGCKKAIIARIISFCMETGNDTLKITDNNQKNIDYYKNLGMIENKTENSIEETNITLIFNKKNMQTYLNKYQVNLSF